jgi:hypothetical protein
MNTPIVVDLNFPILDFQGVEIEKASVTLAKNLLTEADPKHPREKFSELAESLKENGTLTVSYGDWRTVNEWWKKLPLPAFCFTPILRALETAKAASLVAEAAEKEKKKLEEGTT